MGDVIDLDQHRQQSESETAEHGHCPHCQACVPANFSVLVKRSDLTLSAVPDAFAMAFHCPSCGAGIIVEVEKKEAEKKERGRGVPTGIPRGIH
jgi:hypothetical protein